METQYERWYSPVLGREMECKVYGHAGRPALFIPCQNGRFFDFENYQMADVWAPWIESGQVMVCAVDTLDIETWSNKTRDPAWRSHRHEAWMRYLVSEVVPFMQERAKERNGWGEDSGLLAFGCSLGATHAANLYFRFPYQFDRLLALSGIYTADYGFDGYMDELVYLNSPEHYLPQLSPDHPYIEQYNRNKGVICVGLGDWEMPESTRSIDYTLRSKGIHLWVDYWGHDCTHDWPWWYKQVAYFLPYLLD